MSSKQFKIGFCDLGGIFVGKGIKSKFHKHYAHTLLISLGEPFEIIHKKQSYSGEAILIQKNTGFSLASNPDQKIAFIHVAPYTPKGLKLASTVHPVLTINNNIYSSICPRIESWNDSLKNDKNEVQLLLNDIIELGIQNDNNIALDPRILDGINLIMKTSDKLMNTKLAKEVGLSRSHFNRLLKAETGMTFRKFVLYSKLIRSIEAMHQNTNLTQASYIGGFADQGHFSRTFHSNFGIIPSRTLKT